jgi:hypothetical protein
MFKNIYFNIYFLKKTFLKGSSQISYKPRLSSIVLVLLSNDVLKWDALNAYVQKGQVGHQEG